MEFQRAYQILSNGSEKQGEGKEWCEQLKEISFILSLLVCSLGITIALASSHPISLLSLSNNTNSLLFSI